MPIAWKAFTLINIYWSNILVRLRIHLWCTLMTGAPLLRLTHVPLLLAAFWWKTIQNRMRSVLSAHWFKATALCDIHWYIYHNINTSIASTLHTHCCTLVTHSPNSIPTPTLLSLSSLLLLPTTPPFPRRSSPFPPHYSSLLLHPFPALSRKV